MSGGLPSRCQGSDACHPVRRTPDGSRRCDARDADFAILLMSMLKNLKKRLPS